MNKEYNRKKPDKANLRVWMKLKEEAFALEGELSDLTPIEHVDSSPVLEDVQTRVGDS